MTNSKESQERPTVVEVLKFYLAIMRPYLITTVGLGIAYGCWRVDNLPGTYLFLALAAFPFALRGALWGLSRLFSSAGS